MSQRFGNFEPNFLSLGTNFRDGYMNSKWVQKLSHNTASVASPPLSYGGWNSEPKSLALGTGFRDGSFAEKNKKWGGKPSRSTASVASPPALHEKQNSVLEPLSTLSSSSPGGSVTEKKKNWGGKSSRSTASVASPPALHENRISVPEPRLTLSSGSPGGSVAEKKKKKKTKKKKVGKLSQSGGGVASPSVSDGNEVSKDETVHISKNVSSPDDTQKSLSKISKPGSAELSSGSVVEDVVVKCIKQVELEDSKNGSHEGGSYNGKENRNFGWNRRQYNAREGHLNWEKKPSDGDGVIDVNPAENRFQAEQNSLANDGIVSSRYNNVNKNWNSGLNRRQYNGREGHVSWGKKPSYRNGVRDVNVADNRFWSERNSLANDAISPTPLISSGHNNAAYGYRKRDVPPVLLNESSKGAASPQKLTGTLIVSLQSPIGGLGNDSEKLAGRSTNSFEPVIKEPCNSETNFSELPVKCVSYDKELSPGCFDMHRYKRDSAGTNGKQIASNCGRHCLNSPSMYSKMPTQGVMNGIQQYKFREVPSMYEFGKSLHDRMDGIPCCCTDHKLQIYTSGAIIMKQTAVGTKEFRPVDRISSASISNELNLLPDLSRELNNSHLGGNTVSWHQPISYDDPNVYQSAAELLKKFERNGYEAKYREPENTDQFLIGSHVKMKALTAAYQMQVASEAVQLTMDCPVAEFETFIHCAAPVIPTSYVHKENRVSLGTQPSPSLLCEHQIPNVSLHSVWNWYEIPGNYGLDVKAVCPKILTGLPNDSMSFQAYFAPSLSAIQLIGLKFHGCNRLFSSSSEAVHLGHIRVGSFDVALPHGSCLQSLDCSPVYSSDAELIFEFFEVELPHHRRPFYNKILELIGAGTSNPLVYGDPSKLSSLNLSDIHPASWFSVAWYPIYQIPEGCLHASFLTYHSLGHFVQTPGSTLAPGCICFPVIGLQSYNSQDECWFEPKIPSSEGPTSFDTTGILIKRLRTLDENALHFARGSVYKDKVMVQNRHPDYEFFTSRKTRYK